MIQDLNLLHSVRDFCEKLPSRSQSGQLLNAGISPMARRLRADLVKRRLREEALVAYP